MSLKKFNIFVVLISLTVMTLLYLYIAKLLHTNIDAQVRNSVRVSAIELRQQLLSNFNTLQQRFTLYEEYSLQKLEHVKTSLQEEGLEHNLDDLAKDINVNVYDGHYEIYIINKDKVVTESTSKADVGLDYKEYPYFAKELERLKSGGLEYQISAPVFDEFALDIAQYYVMSLDSEHWVMIGFVLPFSEYVTYKTEDLQHVFPSLKELKLFILTYDNIQLINTKVHQKKDMAASKTRKEQYAAMIIEELGLSKSDDSTSIELIAESFAQQPVVMKYADKKREGLAYTLVESSFEDTSDDFMLISRAVFDESLYLSEYNNLKNLMYLFISLVYIFMILGFALMYKAVIQKISVIEAQMHDDNAIEVKGFLFSEFKYFIKRYNNFLGRWKQEVQRLNEITLQDELTKCANRRYFNQKMKEQIDLYRRYSQEFSMIMFDIDDFKAVNDTYGHTEGDHVLQGIASDVRHQLRVSDVLCRIGGEEFAIILPETNRKSALFVAEKIRKVIEKQEYVQNAQITISLGVESFDEHYDFNTFYAAVDKSLYRAKNSGKNCVKSSQDEEVIAEGKGD